MPVQYDVVATLGTYESGGQTKYVNRKVGVILDTQHGLSLKLDCHFSPSGLKKDDSGSVWLKLFPPREFQEKQKQGIQNQIPEQNVHHHQNPPPPQQNPSQAYQQHSQGMNRGHQPPPPVTYDDDIPY